MNRNLIKNLTLHLFFRGVIQLFNAVRKQQKEIDAELEEAGASERKRDKVLKSVDKNSFLDILMGPTKSVHVGRTVDKKEPKVVTAKAFKVVEKLIFFFYLQEEDNSEKAPIWSVLRDDFMMGDGKLKDWDKEVDNDDSGDEVESIGDDDDSS
jgi:Rrp15p